MEVESDGATYSWAQWGVGYRGLATGGMRWEGWGPLFLELDYLAQVKATRQYGDYPTLNLLLGHGNLVGVVLPRIGPAGAGTGAGGIACELTGGRQVPESGEPRWELRLGCLGG